MKKSAIKHSAVKMCFAALLLTVSNVAVIGQFKIPKILKPKQNPPVETLTGQPQNPQNPGGQNRNSSTDKRQTSGEQFWTPFGEYVDDGFTWFHALETNDLDASQLPVHTGWTLKSSVRLMGVYPKRSAFKFVVSKAGKTIGTTRCETGSHNIPRNAPNVQETSYIFAEGCYQKTEMTTKETGKFDVEVFLIDGATNAEKSVRRYKIEVVQIDRVRSGTGKAAKPDSPRYVVSRHSETPASVLYMRPGGTFDYFRQNDGTAQSNKVEVYFNISPTKQGWGMPYAALRCSVNGTRIKLREAGSQTDIISAVDFQARRSYEIYSDRLAAPYSAGGPVYEDDFGFRIFRATLPLTYGSERADPNRTNLKEHPGNWECSMSDNGTVLRTWHWTVGADGMPVKHAEQTGNVNLFSNAYVVETDIPADGTIYDKHLAPVSATEGFFYGQRWISAQGKAAAARVPTKGRLLPVPSNKIK